jgi:hypothetical protein
LNNEIFGLNEIKNEIQIINNTLNNELFGLNEIKNELRAIVPGETGDLTTGAVMRDRDARNMILKVINTSNAPQNVTFRVWNYTPPACPANCFITVPFNVPAGCANEVEFPISRPGGSDPNLQNYEVEVSGIVPGVFVYTTTVDQADRFVGPNTFRTSEFVKRIFNRPCPDTPTP